MPADWSRGGRYERPDRGADEATRGKAPRPTRLGSIGTRPGGGPAPPGSHRARGARQPPSATGCIGWPSASPATSRMPRRWSRMRCGPRPGRSTRSRASRRSEAGSTGSRPTPPTRSFAAARTSEQEISWEDLLPTFDEMGAHAEPVRDWSARAEEPALQTELRTVLTTAINDLPGDYRTAFLLHDVEGSRTPRSPRRCTSACPR